MTAPQGNRSGDPGLSGKGIMKKDTEIRLTETVRAAG